MKKSAVWLIVLAILLLVVLAYLFGPSWNSEDKAPVSCQGCHPLAVLDTNISITPGNVMFQNEDVVLVISPTWYGEIYDNLAAYDTHHDDYLTPADPIFSHVQLVAYKNGKVDFIIPLRSAGVRAISVIPDPQFGMFRIIFLDGTYRWLKMVPAPQPTQ